MSQHSSWLQPLMGVERSTNAIIAESHILKQFTGSKGVWVPNTCM